MVEIASVIARSVAARLTEARAERPLSTSTKSTTTDLVTEMDLWAEQHITAELMQRRRGDGIIGEEGTNQPSSTGVSWHVDPIDGTTNYLYGHPGFSVSLGAAFHGELVAGVVIDALRDELFVARRRGGAFLNGARIAASRCSDLPHALVATGFGYDPARRRRQAEVLTRVLPNVRDIRRMGGAALDFCSVACGRVDAYYEYGIAPWDVAAGSVIAREAGAMVGDLDGRPTLGPMIVAAAPGIDAGLRRLLAENAADLST